MHFNYYFYLHHQHQVFGAKGIMSITVNLFHNCAHFSRSCRYFMGSEGFVNVIVIQLLSHSFISLSHPPC